MSAVQLNTAENLQCGGQYDFGQNYIVESSDNPDFEVRDSEINDEDGVCIQILVFQRKPKIHAVLKCRAAATPASDFPKGLMCTLGGLTTYRVIEAVPSHTEDVTRVDVTLVASFTNS